MSACTQALPPLSLADVEAMLPYIDGCDMRDTWLRVGMALKSEFGDAAFDAWDMWSQGAGNYESRACRASWRGFRARAGGITIGTVVALAKAGGYQFQRREPPTEAEQAAMQKRAQERQERAKREQGERALAAAHACSVAWQEWRAACANGRSDYLHNKGIEGAESIRYAHDGSILVPMIRYDLPRDSALCGLQRIDADGGKRFTYGVAKTACACRLGLVQVGEPIVICEGYATGMTLRMALRELRRQLPVFVAFDAYNLAAVADLVHELYPTSPLVLAVDDDWQTMVRGKHHNTGVEQGDAARDALHEMGAKYVLRACPVFADGMPRGHRDTDFNDLHRLEGLGAVKRQLDTVLHAIEELQRYA